MDSLNRQDSAKEARLINAYLSARRELEDFGYLQEIEWQESRTLDGLAAPQFLTEFAWVVLCAGMRESIVRQRFPSFSRAFLDWKSADEIVARSAECRSAALRVFNHAAKVDAILSATRWLAQNGVDTIKAGVASLGAGFLMQFSFMGPITSLHLAKNIGLCVAKPDRHLKRIAKAASYDSVTSLCETIAGITAHPIAVVDLVLWRYATLNRDYLNHFRQVPQSVTEA
jgi:hypothetical protein